MAHATFTEESAVLDSLLDLGGIRLLHDLAREDLDLLQQRLLLVLGGEVFAVVRQMVAAHENLD